MTWLYVAEVTLVVSALALTPWMKRAGDRNWRAYCTVMRFKAIVTGVTERLERLATEMQKVAAPARRLGHQIDALACAFRGFVRRDGEER